MTQKGQMKDSMNRCLQKGALSSWRFGTTGHVSLQVPSNSLHSLNVKSNEEAY